MDAMEHQYAAAILAWQIELGADESIADDPVDRYEVPAAAPKAKILVAPVAARPQKPPQADPVAVAEAAAKGAPDLAALKAAMQAFPHCDLQRGARNMVFADGTPGARVMVIGEAPGREEDREGRPFAGRAGAMLDRMFAAIGMGRAAAQGTLYVINAMPWHPPQNRDPRPEEIAVMQPFLRRHVELAAPQVVVAMGNLSCQMLLGQRGITRLRGKWAEVQGGLGAPSVSAPVLPLVLPMYHPAFLQRTPAAKREAWADLLMLNAKLTSQPTEE